MFFRLRIVRRCFLFPIASLVVAAVLAAQSTPAPTGESKSDSSIKSDFNPIGKSFSDLVFEGQRAFDAGEYDRVIQLMDYALTLPVTKLQAANATFARGSAYALKGDLDRAMQDFDAGLKLNPRSAEGYRNRGLALAKKNDIDGAMKDFSQAIELQPNQWKPYLNRGECFAVKHEWDAALKDLGRVIELNPKSAPAYADKAFIENRYKNFKEAISDSDKAVAADSNFLGGYMARAYARIGLKQYAQAEEDVRVVPTLKAKNHSAQFNAVAWLRATCPADSIRNGKEAVSQATSACDLTHWKNAKYIDTLAAAYAEAGDFESAIKYQEQALDLVENSPPPSISEMRDRLKLYQKHQPCRDEREP